MKSDGWMWNPTGHLAVTTVAVAMILFTGVGCDGDRHHVLSDDPGFAITDASVSVDGQDVAGMTLSRGHGEGGVARFEAILLDESESHADATVWVEHHRPGMMGMMGSDAMFQLHDDGTHGDHVAGDGVYCYDDVDGEHGCHTSETALGEHRYEFHAMDHEGHESNHMTLTVTITD